MAAALPLTEHERRVLHLHDRLQHLGLELALFRAQKFGTPTSPALPAESCCEYQDAQQRLLEARALLALRDVVVEGLVTAQPKLAAVHGGMHASLIERDLLPHIELRDLVAIQTADVSAKLRQARANLSDLEVDMAALGRRNADLAAEVLRLSGRDHLGHGGGVDDARANRRVVALESDLCSGRHRWRVIKGAASAVVAGSGVDWARDKRLRDMVLDQLD